VIQAAAALASVRSLTGYMSMPRLDAVAAHLQSSTEICSCSAADLGTPRGPSYLASSDFEHRANPEGLSDLPARRVADYSGGYERRFPHRTIKCAVTAAGGGTWPLPPLHSHPQLPFSPVAPVAAACADYLTAHPHITGLLLARPAGVLEEEYQHGRTPHHRLQSWSMAKSVTSLLLGICLDRGLVRSLDDLAGDYCPALAGTLHGGLTLRHLINMSSGAAVDHIPSNIQIYKEGFTNPNSSVRKTVAGWAGKAPDHGPGERFNYNELCPLSVGMVIRAVTKQSLSEFCESALWQPLGAEADASWQTDSEGAEFNCIGFGCCLRDWGRLGLLVAQRGLSGAEGTTRVVSDAYFSELCQWRQDEQQAVFVEDAIGLQSLLAAGQHVEGVSNFGVRFKAFFWHCRPDGSQPRFVGHGGQTVLCDIPSHTVLVQTAVEEFDERGHQLAKLLALFEAATKA
jgi:hypothetical protein